MVKFKIVCFVGLVALWSSFIFLILNNPPEMDAALQQLKGTGNSLTIELAHAKNVLGILGPIALLLIFLKLFAGDLKKLINGKKDEKAV